MWIISCGHSLGDSSRVGGYLYELNALDLVQEIPVKGGVRFTKENGRERWAAGRESGTGMVERGAPSGRSYENS